VDDLRPALHLGPEPEDLLLLAAESFGLPLVFVSGVLKSLMKMLDAPNGLLRLALQLAIGREEVKHASAVSKDRCHEEDGEKYDHALSLRPGRSMG
jgi:hypothetical protein